MPRPPIRSSRNSPASLPPDLAFDAVPSERLQAAACLIVLAVCAGLLCTVRSSGIWAGSAALLTLALAWQPLREVVYLRGPHCVRRIEWTAEGIWRISNGVEPFARVRLHPATAVMGPLMFLIWCQDGRKRWCVLDCVQLDQRLWRTLLVRLRIEAGRAPHRATPGN